MDIIKSVKKTRKLVDVDLGSISSRFSAEFIVKVFENVEVNCLTSSPVRITLPDAPAPTTKVFKKNYLKNKSKHNV